MYVQEDMKYSVWTQVRAASLSYHQGCGRQEQKLPLMIPSSWLLWLILRSALAGYGRKDDGGLDVLGEAQEVQAVDLALPSASHHLCLEP